MGKQMSLGELLADFRESLDKDQKEVAEDLNLPAASLSFYENDRRTPPYGIFARLLHYYNARLTIESDVGKWVFKPRGKSIRIEKIPDDEELDLLAGLEENEREDLISYIRRRKHSRRRSEEIF